MADKEFMFEIPNSNGSSYVIIERIQEFINKDDHATTPYHY